MANQVVRLENRRGDAVAGPKAARSPEVGAFATLARIDRPDRCDSAP